MKPPILLFVHRRSEHLPLVLDRLEACDGFSEHQVTVHADGPRNIEEQASVDEVRTLVRERLRPNMRLVEQPTNRGLANSIIAEVTAACEAHGQVIVLEDDLLLAPMALSYFTEGLSRYADEPRVMQIAGFNFAVPAIRQRGRSVFLQHPTSWGWATNASSWTHFDPLCTGWEQLLEDQDFHRRFAIGNAMRFTDMLRWQMAGQTDSWAIRWHFAVVKAKGLALFPPESMVHNIGHLVGKATHGQRSARLLPFGPMWDKDAIPPFPDSVACDDWAVDAWSRRLRWSSYGLAMKASAAIRRLQGG